MTEVNSRSSNSVALFNFLVSIVPYFFLLAVAWVLSGEHYGWVLLLAIPTHIFHARLFVIMHDCGHNSFFKTKILNDLVGHVCAWFYFTPFYLWRELHNKHHRNQGYLERRGESLDVWTMTADEYSATDTKTRFFYRSYRHPLVLFFFAPFVLFLLIFRVPFERFSAKAVANVLLLDVVYATLFHFAPEFSLALFLVLLPSLTLSFVMASFLFYIQHQFADSYWTRSSGGKNREISTYGSSFLKIPAFLEWCYGYINYHHLHHLDVRIPLYKLKSLHRESELAHEIRSDLSLRDALRASKYKLWDEKTQKFVTF